MLALCELWDAEPFIRGRPCIIGAPGRRHGSILISTTRTRSPWIMRGTCVKYIYTHRSICQDENDFCAASAVSEAHATPKLPWLDFVTTAIMFLSFLLIAACTALATAAVHLSNANTSLTLLYQNNLNFTVRLSEP